MFCPECGEQFVDDTYKQVADELAAALSGAIEVVKVAHRAGYRHGLGPCVCVICKAEGTEAAALAKYERMGVEDERT
jgi:hypothetical protein